SDVEEGGETIFPAAKGNISSVPWWNELSECGKQGLAVKPKMGDALLFWSMRPDATLDPSSLHGGCPVIMGNKWSSTKWMHLEEYKDTILPRYMPWRSSAGKVYDSCSSLYSGVSPTILLFDGYSLLFWPNS
ncbi:hypothetical protein Gorai_012793, partial [Gossypium raimondii]|nr:hypothetical protein [Gossypium raimondii]